MGRAHEYMVTGRKVKNKPDAPNAVLGLFHQLPEELTDSLIVKGRQNANATRRDFTKRLRKQEEKSEQKEKLISKGEEAKVFNARLHECIVPSLAI